MMILSPLLKVLIRTRCSLELKLKTDRRIKRENGRKRNDEFKRS